MGADEIRAELDAYLARRAGLPPELRDDSPQRASAETPEVVGTLSVESVTGQAWLKMREQDGRWASGAVYLYAMSDGTVRWRPEQFLADGAAALEALKAAPDVPRTEA